MGKMHRSLVQPGGSADRGACFGVHGPDMLAGCTGGEQVVWNVQFDGGIVWTCESILVLHFELHVFMFSHSIGSKNSALMNFRHWFILVRPHFRLYMPWCSMQHGLKLDGPVPTLNSWWCPWNVAPSHICVFALHEMLSMTGWPSSSNTPQKRIRK